MAAEEPVHDAAAAGERSQAEKDFLIKQSIVGELEEFFPDEFLDRVKARFQARLAERARQEPQQQPEDGPGDDGRN